MRRPRLDTLPTRVDLVVIGGGITGAGILREAVRSGARALLLEQNDFASGTSSGSSKLVHGGLRYLKTGQWRLTRESVHERQCLLREGAGLVERQPFLMPLQRGVKPGRLAMTLGLWIYDRMAGEGASRWVDAATALQMEPAIRGEGLTGAMLYEDARTDDARLVLRLLFEAIAQGGLARNYARVVEVLRSGGRVRGVGVQDLVEGTAREIEADMVINATGVWAGALAGAGAPSLRPLRGSHWVFPAAKLPISRAVGWLHPRDRRPIFAYPWEGAVLCGTTDVDHETERFQHPRMSPEEAAYLLEGLAHEFPGLGLAPGDALCAYSAVRPIVAGGKAAPSDESRESALWSEPGMVGVTGGKLTTFAVTARQALRAAAAQVPRLAPVAGPRLDAAGASRLAGRLGAAAERFEADMPAGERATLPGAPYSLAELRWAARHEHVVHLDDLLLRRTRLGLVTSRGGAEYLPRLEPICREELGWDATTWHARAAHYLDLWQRDHAPAAP